MGSELTLRVNDPSAAALVALVVPSSEMVAPIRGSPDSPSSTVPVRAMDWADRGNVLQLSNAMVNSAIHWIWRDVLWFIVLICKALGFVFLGMVRLRKGQTLQKVYNVHLPARVSGNCGLKSEKFSR